MSNASHSIENQSQLQLINSEAELVRKMESFYDDPLGFVIYSFPWGEGILKGEDGPDTWQVEVLETIRNEIRLRASDEALQTAIRMAVVSGHGIGKTALISWILLWFISTRPNPQIVCTANTFTQLSGKTWRELAKWHKLAINSHWFEWTAKKFYMKESVETWFASAVPWSRNKSEAFAGTHEKHVLFLFDEASLIDDMIWEVSEGAMTTKGAMWIAFGNGTRNTGRFKECFGKFRHRWRTLQIDSRTAKKANNTQIQEWLKDYGEDSDFFRVRVRGLFPKRASTQLIAEEYVTRCMFHYKVAPSTYEHLPVIIGADIARYGDDQTVIFVRQGRKQLDIKKYRGLSTIEASEKISEVIQKWNSQHVFVDGVGLGAGVVDYLIEKKGYKFVVDVQSGGSPDNDLKYHNKRDEMWARMAKIIEQGFELMEDTEMYEELVSIEYGYTMSDKLKIESVKDMKSRGLASPDTATAFALTLAYNVNLRQNDNNNGIIRSQENTSVSMQKKRILRNGSLKR